MISPMSSRSCQMMIVSVRLMGSLREELESGVLML